MSVLNAKSLAIASAVATAVTGIATSVEAGSKEKCFWHCPCR